MKRHIPHDLVEDYISQIISSYEEDENGEPIDLPSDPEEYKSLLEGLKYDLLLFHEQLPLVYGLKAVLDWPDERMESLYNNIYMAEPEEIRTIAQFLYEAFMPANGLNDDEIEIIDEELDDFRVKQGIFARIEPDESLRYIALKNRIHLDRLVYMNPYWEGEYGTDSPLEAGDIIRLKDENDCEWL